MHQQTSHGASMRCVVYAIHGAWFMPHVAQTYTHKHTRSSRADGEAEERSIAACAVPPQPQLSHVSLVAETINQRCAPPVDCYVLLNGVWHKQANVM